MPRSVTIAAGKTNIHLPDGRTYDAGKTVILTNEQFNAIRSSLVPGTIIDNGPLSDVGGTVVAQAANVTAITTADATDLASAIALVNANKAKTNALLAAFTGAGKPMST